MKTLKIAIDKRDKNLFSFLHSVKIARSDQIARDTYPGLGKWGLSKRLYRLERAKFIQGFISCETQNLKAYSLTRKAFLEFLASGAEKRKELRSDAVRHDLTLVDLRHCIFKLPRILEYFTENTLQTWKLKCLGSDLTPFVQLNSDAALKISFEGGHYYLALEYESARKYAARYQEILTRYYSTHDIPLVLYVFETTETLKRVRSQEEKLFRDKTPKFFYATLEQLTQNGNFDFRNRRGEILQLGASI